MNAKHLLQIPIVLTLLFGSVGTNQPVRADTIPPSISISISPTLLSVNESATATVSLGNVPAGGYTSAEFSCTYPADRLQVSSIVVTGLFGPDPATAIYDQHDGSFIVGVAGSQDYRANAGWPAFTFQLKGLGTGQATVDCTARVSDGTNVLTGIGSAAAALTVMEPTATPTLEPLACDKAEFIADITVPPGTEMAPGTQFIKTWRLQNVGSCTWTTSYRLAFYGGEQMGAASSVGFPVNVAPGQMIDLSLDMIAPATPGSHHGYWIFQNDTGKPFGIGPLGNQAWLVRIVVSNATATPTPTGTISPSPEPPTFTPGGSTSTPIPAMAYDFAENLCAATWFSGAGQLPCPGIDGDPKGFALKLDSPRLETGAIDGRPGILTFPQNVQNGYIQGFYPPFAVQDGDRFRSTIGCEGGATLCYVGFRLDYQVGSDPIRTFWGPWLERYEGRPFSVDVDLSSLAGRNVKFILTVLSTGVATGDRALWASPMIYRAGAAPVASSTPAYTSEPTNTPTPTGEAIITPIPGSAFDFTANACTAVWTSGEGALPCPGIDGNPDGFVIKLRNPSLESGIPDPRHGLLTVPRNAYNGYIQGYYPPFHVQDGDRFQTSISCEGSSAECYVAFRLDYQVAGEPIQTFWGPILEHYDGLLDPVNIDLSPLAGKDVRFILIALSVGSSTGDRPLWLGPMIYRPGAASATPEISPTPTDTATPLPENWWGLPNWRYGFEVAYPGHSRIVPGANDNLTRIDLPSMTGTNLREKYVEVIVTENLDPCQSSRPAPQSSEMVIYNGTSFLKQIGSTSTAGHTYKWTAYSTARAHVCVSLDFVLHSIEPVVPPAQPYSEAAESAVFAEMAARFRWMTSPTPTPIPSGNLTGKVLAGKPVTLDLFDLDNWPIATTSANPDGTFSLAVPAGTYHLVARASGHLSAMGLITITDGSFNTQPTISLLPGDIDDNFMVDQFDAMTIGMNYNKAWPPAADLNNDRTINVLDLEILAKNYRKVGPIPWEG